MIALPSDPFQRKQKLAEIIRLSVSTSDFAAPDSPGLALPEIVAVCLQFGFGEGEIHTSADVDLRGHFIDQVRGSRYVVTADPMQAGLFRCSQTAPRALEFADTLHRILLKDARDRRGGGSMGRVALLAQVDGTDNFDAVLALRMLVRSGFVTLDKEEVRLKEGWGGGYSPSAVLEQYRQAHCVIEGSVELFREVLAKVKDVIARRSDRRPAAREPLDALAAELQAAGLRHHLTWWRQVVSDFRSADPGRMPLASTILAYALVEGALTVLVHEVPKRSSERLSRSLEGSARGWKVQDILGFALRIGAISQPLRARVLPVAEGRNRIHAGRLLALAEEGKPLDDVRPETARHAAAVAEDVARAVLEWLRGNPRVAT